MSSPPHPVDVVSDPLVVQVLPAVPQLNLSLRPVICEQSSSTEQSLEQSVDQSPTKQLSKLVQSSTPYTEGQGLAPRIDLAEGAHEMIIYSGQR